MVCNIAVRSFGRRTVVESGSVEVDALLGAPFLDEKSVDRFEQRNRFGLELVRAAQEMERAFGVAERGEKLARAASQSRRRSILAGDAVELCRVDLGEAGFAARHFGQAFEARPGGLLGDVFVQELGDRLQGAAVVFRLLFLEIGQPP